MMRRLWHTTFGLVTLTALAFALATAAIGATAFIVTHEALEQQLDHRIAAETKALIDEGDDGPDGVATAIRRREAARNTGSLEYKLVDPAGRTVAGTLDATVPPGPGYVELLPYRRAGVGGIVQSLTTLLPSGHRLLVGADRGAIDELDRTMIKLFAGAFGATLLLGIAAAWVVGAVTRSRLARIDRTALAIIDGDLSRRIPMLGDDDAFDRVADTLNRMLDRIGMLMANLRQVSSDVAHDLRTPLTRLHNRLDEALASDDRDIQREAIGAAADQSRELLDIFAALLRIAEVEGLGPRATFQTINLSGLLGELVETYHPDMEASGHVLIVSITPDLTITGDRRLLQQMVTNLLDNSLVHTPQGTQVTIAAERVDDRILLTIADDGPGVPAKDAPRLFQRFARAQSSRSGSGHGLGLALVAAIASAHRGTASLVPSRRFVVLVDLPDASNRRETGSR